MGVYHNGYKQEGQVTDDGTNYVYWFGGVKLFAVAKSSKQMLFQAGSSSDQVI